MSKTVAAATISTQCGFTNGAGGTVALNQACHTVFGKHKTCLHVFASGHLYVPSASRPPTRKTGNVVNLRVFVKKSCMLIKLSLIHI